SGIIPHAQKNARDQNFQTEPSLRAARGAWFNAGATSGGYGHKAAPYLWHREGPQVGGATIDGAGCVFRRGCEIPCGVQRDPIITAPVFEWRQHMANPTVRTRARRPLRRRSRRPMVNAVYAQYVVGRAFGQRKEWVIWTRR